MPAFYRFLLSHKRTCKEPNFQDYDDEIIHNLIQNLKVPLSNL